MKSLIGWIAVLALALPAQALAISQQNQEKLAKYFEKLGPVRYALYTPLGGPEIGAAVIGGTQDEGGGITAGRLYVVDMAGKGGMRTLLDEPVSSTDKRPPFTFLYVGKHLLTYPTTFWADADGRKHRRGDLLIRDLTQPEGLKTLFQMRDAVDLSFQAGSAASEDNMLWQPLAHFLNTGDRLPVRNTYIGLGFDPGKSEYRLYQHLQALPDAATVEEANLNDRALLQYEAGLLLQASETLSQASAAAETSQRVIAHNQALIQSEISELQRQDQLSDGRPYDEALLRFWEGDFALCLRQLDLRKGQAPNDYDLALRGLALANLERWPEVDTVTVALEKQAPGFLPEYLAELVRAAQRQGHGEIVATYLRALEVAGKDSPAYAALVGEIIMRSGNLKQAKALLERYLAGRSGAEYSPPRYVLYQVYHAQGDSAGCDRLAKEALTSPLTDLETYVKMIDYFDLSPALVEIPVERTDRLKAPKNPLETFGVQ